jgi:tetratricopeptide (TPR) repeat protein
METRKVSMWEEDYVIPTYKVYPPEKNPLFIEKRAYQGSTGKVYPLPVTEKISDTKEDVVYKAVFLENEYLKVMILPELGGRIQRAYDKTNGYDFVYYNHVIKPALVGLTGPWISGGIEFNWPQHHRPSTYSPVDYHLSENADGSCTIYVGETDKMYGTKGMAAITLYPEKAYIEIKGQLYNPTDLPQTFLWWANPAVPVNDNTYSVFPPDVNAVMDHGKRAVSTFPIATGEYYKADYSAGVDISRYKNVKVPTSYMAAHSDYNFIGNYDEGVEAGLLHVADHHISPGKKQWTWGNGDFGRSWDRNLTETDGPYIELMTGVFTDNQPDFTWLKPQEEKTFVQYFMPYKGVGRVGNATKEAAVSLTDSGDGHAVLKVYTTGVCKDTRITVRQKETVLYEKTADLSPEECFEATFAVDGNIEDCAVAIMQGAQILVSYKVYKPKLEPVPKPADAIPAPEKLKTPEELYLAATHLEQYRHATREPADYYRHGLELDGTDIRLNNGYGLLLYRRGQIKESIKHFQAAVKKQTWKNPNPYHGEGYFNLGLALAADGQEEKAFDAFYKSTWSAETQSAGFFWLARLACRRRDYEEALEYIEKSMIRNWHNMKGRTLKAAILRTLGVDSTTFVKECLKIDPLSQGCLYEQAAATDDYDLWLKTMRTESHNFKELAQEYIEAGLYEDAIRILRACPQKDPICWYTLGYVYKQLKEGEKAKEAFENGEKSCPDYCFPNRVEEIRILHSVIEALPEAPMAHYYLGNLLYDKKQYKEAAGHWATAAEEKEDLSPAYRNLAIYYYNKENDAPKALEVMERACALDPEYPRIWLEYDQLAARMNLPAEKRLEIMESHPAVTAGRDDLYLRYLTLLNDVGRYQEALGGLASRQFHPWEGGEGKVSSQYKYALTHLAMAKLDEKQPQEALKLLEATLSYPNNLGEGKLPNVPDNEAHYYMGLAYKQLGETEKAEEYFRRAASGPQEPGSVLYYNDQPSDFIYYQGLANLELGLDHAAKKSFHQLLTFGEQHLFDEVEYDFFAVSLPEIEVFQEDLELRNIQYCNYLRALGHLGLGENEKARELFREILAKQSDYQGALAR